MFTALESPKHISHVFLAVWLIFLNVVYAECYFYMLSEALLIFFIGFKSGIVSYNVLSVAGCVT